MKLLSMYLTLLLLTLGMVACDKDDTPDPNVTFTATLNGANEIPPNSSTATGTVSLVYNTTTKVFVATITHNLSLPTGGHIHFGAAGSNGGVIFAFTNLSSPIVYTSGALNATQESDLYAGLYYVNLHTDAFPNGEIRGQIRR
ncbi:MAG: CHRD domain-containing protein [Saprospiraceae bacterium]|nr:CHRD domain-containing protein [Saprospiraceae bacterium]MBK7810547.1 CHRD domain-containing protein [Saprospiraceae bacterium]MBK9630136.1 CHRD domain-containing protein [Saprospiraceae bacterium]